MCAYYISYSCSDFMLFVGWWERKKKSSDISQRFHQQAFRGRCLDCYEAGKWAKSDKKWRMMAVEWIVVFILFLSLLTLELSPLTFTNILGNTFSSQWQLVISVVVWHQLSSSAYSLLGFHCKTGLATGFRPPSATVFSAEPFLHRTGTLRCLQKEMATYRHWSVSLWRDPDDVSHCWNLSFDKTEWQLISATLCG